MGTLLSSEPAVAFHEIRGEPCWIILVGNFLHLGFPLVFNEASRFIVGQCVRVIQRAGMQTHATAFKFPSVGRSSCQQVTAQTAPGEFVEESEEDNLDTVLFRVPLQFIVAERGAIEVSYVGVQIRVFHVGLPVLMGPFKATEPLPGLSLIHI